MQPLAALVAQRRWIGLDSDARDLKFDRWLADQVPTRSVVLRVDGFEHALAMLRSGLGIALLEQIDNDDPTALIGLPLIRTCQMLRAAGLAVP